MLISHSWSLSSRARWAAAFALLFLATAAVPVLAAESPAGEVSLAPSSLQAQADWLPDAADVQEGIETVEGEEAAREHELESPEAVAERGESLDAFADVGAGAAQELLQAVFADQLAKLNFDPARALSDAEIVRTIGATAATVSEDGDGALLDAGIPVRTEDEDGDLRKVDLSLEATAEGFETANALSDVQIGDSAEEPVEVGEEGVAISQVGAEETSTSRRFGDQNVFHFEALTDTDTLVSPTATGVEIFNLLRSEESPETFRFEIELPTGAELRPDGQGGAAVVREGETIAAIPFPTAVDAQGTDVPVDLTIEGSSIVLHVDHRQGDYAMPILLDPILEDWVNYNTSWHNGKNLQALYNGAWQWTSSPGSVWVSTGCIYACWGSGNGLYVSAPSGNYGANNIAHWAYSAPNMGSYVSKVWLIPFYRHDHGCNKSQYGQPHDYEGFWGDGQWNLVHTNQAINVGSYANESWGRAFVVGLGTGGGVNIPCWRDLYVGGAAVWLDDWEWPYVNSVSGVPTGWLKKDSTSRTLNVTASDSGLGVQQVRMFGVGTNEWYWNHGWCAGTYANRCPTLDSGQITFKTEGFPTEGEVKFSVQAIDPTDKRWALERTLKVDGVSPTITLNGQLANITGEQGSVEKPPSGGNDELSLPTYNLKIEAKDGSPTELRSGVKEISVYLDGKTTPEETKTQPSGMQQSCDSCPLTMEYKLKLPGLSAGDHTLKIVAVDFAGNVVNPKREIEFEYMPATGMKEEYVLQHIPLPDGHDYSGEAEYRGPELAVNVMNGNVIYHERDFEVQTRRADLELERFYNSQLPTEQDTQWGRGWTIAQTPEFEPQPGQSPPQKATMVRTSAITGGVDIPSSEGQPTFSSGLHATIEKTSGGAYEVSYRNGAEVSVFAADGRIEETRFGDDSPIYMQSGEPAPFAVPTYASSFGSSGTGNGQFSHPAGVAVDSKGNIWVVDQDNDRVQKFNEAGSFLSSFGSSGTGNGQFGRPTDVAVDLKGNLWVTDADNNRIQKFNDKGEFLAKFGSSGTGNGQFSGPEGIAADDESNVWVADTGNGRLQKFNEAGEFIKSVSSKGSGQGQLGEPTGLDIGPGNKVWVADWQNNRVAIFDEAGQFLEAFGSYGTGPGEFDGPDVIEVDVKGNIWVGDQNNDRVQRFHQSGEYLDEFGASGSGQGQFSFGQPMGIASDAKGNIWVTDTGNNRVQKWPIPGYVLSGEEIPAPFNPPPAIEYAYDSGAVTGMEIVDQATPESDPAVEINVSDGLVESVVGDEAGETLYSYEAGRLTAKVEMDEQEVEEEVEVEEVTNYTNDSSGRLKRIELPNGTWAEITYDSTSRATQVTVDPAGSAGEGATHFWYGEEPRKTIVWGGGNPEIIYSIGEDGSVFKWAYAQVPPAINSISGSFWANRNSAAPVENKDQTLFVTGSSPHQIASVQIRANGNAILAEETCEDPSEPPSKKCEQVTLPWVSHPAQHAPGQLNLEAVVTDFFGHSTAERFFVTIPQQPPPDPEAPERPTFDKIKKFREEFGLDRNKSLTPHQLTEMILELLYEWERQDAAPMRSVEEWGIPMRQAELDEMNYRRWYINQASRAIPEWAEENAASTYGGFYVDERAGSKIYVGFTENQAASVAALKQSGVLVAPQEQIAEFPTPPTRSVVSLEATEESVFNALQADPSMAGVTSGVEFSPESNLVEVGSTNPVAVRSFLDSHFGVNAPIKVNSEGPMVPMAYRRWQIKGPVAAGQALDGLTEFETANICTAAFGARDQVGEERGEPIYAYFTLTAGHCFKKGVGAYRRSSRTAETTHRIGTVKRFAFGSPGQQGYMTDAEAILIDPTLRSHGVFYGNPKSLLSMLGTQAPWLGMPVCMTGQATEGWACGVIKGRRWGVLLGRKIKIAIANVPVITGDSGGPVWNYETQKAVGVISTGLPAPGVPCRDLGDEKEWCPLMGMTPILPFKGKPHPAGVGPSLDVEVLKDR